MATLTSLRSTRSRRLLSSASRKASHTSSRNISAIGTRAISTRKMLLSNKRYNTHFTEYTIHFAKLSTFSNHARYNIEKLLLNTEIHNDKSSRPRILATSSTNASLTLQEQGIMTRFLRWCKKWLETLWEALHVTLRVSEIGLRFSPLLILSPAAYLANQLVGSQRPSVISNLAWNYFFHAIQQLGPGYIKLCQWIATRRDIFPASVCDRLSKLHDQGYPHSDRASERILREAFGDDYKEKGLTLEEVIGTGSAAQVYRGSLTTVNESTGEQNVQPVAVKVLHPGFQRQIENDIWLMDTVAKWLHALPSESIKMLCLPRAVRTFGGNLRLQSDLTVESDNLKQFRSNFYGKENDASASSIFFPRPIEGWVDSKVLVEDLVEDAKPIADFLKDHSELGLRTRKELAGPLLRAFLKMVFQDNFVHSDIHPGNVLIQTTTQNESFASGNPLSRLAAFLQGNDTDNDSGNGNGKVKRSIVFLDAGIVTSLSENDKRNLKDLFRAVILNDGYEAGRLMVERARYERCSQVPGGVDAFATGVGNIVSEFHDRRKAGLTLGAVRIGGLLSQVLDLCREHGVEIDPAMSSIVISTLVLEGLGRSLEPSLNLMDCAVPFVLGRGRV